VAELESIGVHQDFNTDIFSFIFTYRTAEKESVRIVYAMTYEWLLYEDLNVEVREDIVNAVDFGARKDRQIAQLKQYTTLFWQKTGKYFSIPQQKNYKKYRQPRINVPNSPSSMIVDVLADFS